MNRKLIAERLIEAARGSHLPTAEPPIEQPVLPAEVSDVWVVAEIRGGGGLSETGGQRIRDAR